MLVRRSITDTHRPRVSGGYEGKEIQCPEDGGSSASPPRPLSLVTFDDQNPSMNGYTGQVTLKGYDNMTGLGTPNGQRFISALRTLEG